jgi:hypothetical protein
LTEAIDIYDHIDPRELKEAYLACIPQRIPKNLNSIEKFIYY